MVDFCLTYSLPKNVTAQRLANFTCKVPDNEGFLLAFKAIMG